MVSGCCSACQTAHLDAGPNQRQANALRYKDLFTNRADEESGLPTERSEVRHIYNQYVIRVAADETSVRSNLAQKQYGRTYISGAAAFRGAFRVF